MMASTNNTDGIVSAYGRRVASWVDRAVASLNARASEPIRVTWGFHSKDDEDRERAEPVAYRRQVGVIRYYGTDIKLSITHFGNPDIITPVVCMAARFPRSHTLPLDDPKMLYNVVRSSECGGVARLLTIPCEGKICAIGVGLEIPVMMSASDRESARLLDWALLSLSMGVTLAFQALDSGESDDDHNYWGMDGG